MTPKRTIGMTIVAIVSLLLGVSMAIGNTAEVIRGETFDGIPVTRAMGVLGLAGAVFAALLAAGGLGTWQVKPYGRRFSLLAAGGTILTMALAVVLFGLSFGFFLLGVVYPVLVLILYNLPGWRAAFRPAVSR